MAREIAAPSCPSRYDFEALIEGRPMALFDIVRLHEALTSPLLTGTPAEITLNDFHLRGGLPEKSITAAIRVFDSDAFNKFQASLGGMKVIAKSVADVMTKDAAAIEMSLQKLRQGYVFREEGETGGTGGRWRISTRQATAIHQGLVRLADDHGKITIPPLDELFSHDQRRFPLGTRLGTRPLERLDGAIY